ncbi:MAG: MATE family efflux transporter [Paludibacteraceae bacterium]|nr:MATE family efflux transporter [Paludibacteraceae bacterium]
MNKEILRLAIPAIATNISIPILGLVDTYIVAHLSPLHIGAIGTGCALINMLYWNFGFIRMSTSGMTAQAYGSNDMDETANTLTRSLLFSIVSILLILAIKDVFCEFVFTQMETPMEIRRYAEEYFKICVWGAIPTLILYSLKGWFIGMQNTLYPMTISISMNIINIFLSYTFVYLLGMGIEGVAYGTVLSQYIALIAAMALWYHKYSEQIHRICWEKATKMRGLYQMLKINSTIFVRSLCLVSVTTFIPFAGAKEGALILAGNTLLMHFFSFFSYFLDGFAYAGEALTGKYIGAKASKEMRRSVQYLFIWGIGIACIFSAIYLWGTESILAFMTNQAEVITSIDPYIKWVIAIPIVGFAAFLWDGIMVGATRIRPMFYGTGTATLVFFLLYRFLIKDWGNHAIWFAFCCYLATRSIVQTGWWSVNEKEIIK